MRRDFIDYDEILREINDPFHRRWHEEWHADQNAKFDEGQGHYNAQDPEEVVPPGGYLDLQANAQSTHTASVHRSVSESASRLKQCYGIQIESAQKLDEVIEKLQLAIDTQPVKGEIDSEHNLTVPAALSRRAIQTLLEPTISDYLDRTSAVTLKQLLALVYLAVHDDTLRQGDLADAMIQLNRAFYHIQRQYNLDRSNEDNGSPDSPSCPAGMFNLLVAVLISVHPEVEVRLITSEQASFSLPLLVRHYAKAWLETLTVDAFSELQPTLRDEGIGLIWPNIQRRVTKAMFEEFGSLYHTQVNTLDFDELYRTDALSPRFIDLIANAKYVDIAEIVEVVSAKYSQQNPARYSGSHFGVSSQTDCHENGGSSQISPHASPPTP